MIRNIIFDWSGVINDNAQTTFCTAMAVLKRFGIDKTMTFDEFKKAWRIPYMRFYNLFIPTLTDEQQRPIYREAYARCPKPKAYQGMLEFLRDCRAAGIKLYVVSSDPENHIKREIHEYGMDGLFEEVFFEVHDKLDTIQAVARRYSMSYEDSIFISDSDYEIGVGRQAGIKSAGVAWGAYAEERLKVAQPDYIFRNMNDLYTLIKE
ncbi:MAG: HAD family hydrolase [Patescibacteria group bacterium]